MLKKSFFIVQHYIIFFIGSLLQNLVHKNKGEGRALLSFFLLLSVLKILIQLIITIKNIKL